MNNPWNRTKVAYHVSLDACAPFETDLKLKQAQEEHP